MGRPASSIQAEINRLETFLSGSATTIANVGNDGTTVGMINRTGAEKRLDTLYQQLARADGSKPMLVRGVVTGLRR